MLIVVYQKRKTMQLTQYTDYSIRVLIYLCIHDKQLATINEIAKSYHISRNHLGKIVHHLALSGYISTARGKGGGMRLSRSPEKIILGEVIRRTEGEIHLAECFSDLHNTCPISAFCQLKGVLYEARNSFFSVLDSYTLADIVKNECNLRCALPASTV
ncbi:DNA-binding transcriptional regulator [Candidatus Nitrosacidococcus tergens]|uniref:DNA-binding transcriptional regulator n=2 Tax=Candidatus Nitrosacidococcus tergens TaxID=553981 RepID=A0A7G1Q815_9GAMM|nr:DNA-binding transcriptional regulator [Candidatus Nitrosacidococcus tergens]